MSLWFVPVLCVLAGVAVSFITIAIDRAADYRLIPEQLTGGPDSAVQILSTIAASMVSLAALVLTITMVVVQLAMGQFSPRIVQTILRDKPSQIAVGVFVATFAHAMLALREVRSVADTVPGLAIVVAYALVLVSIVLLVTYVHHIGQALRVSALIELVGNRTRQLLARDCPREIGDAPAPDGNVIACPSSGVVTAVAYDHLVDVASRAGCVLRLVPALGAFVPAGAPLFVVEGDRSRLDDADVTDGVTLSLERTLENDSAYGLRLLVDIAERSLSDSPFQDPTTAVQAIDRLHDCLRQVAQRQLPNGEHFDAKGVLRVVEPVMDWDAYVHLAFDEIRLAGAASPQVTRRLVDALGDLMTVVPPARRAVLEDELALLGASVERVAGDSTEHELSLVPDRQGIGIAAGTEARAVAREGAHRRRTRPADSQA
jgi:uncharacterized membrane protein